MAFTGDIADLTRRNSFFRREVFTNEHSQLVVMSIEAGEDIGEETHDVDQIHISITFSANKASPGSVAATSRPASGIEY